MTATHVQQATIDRVTARRTIAHIGEHGRSLCGARITSQQANPNAVLCVVCASLKNNERMWQR